MQSSPCARHEGTGDIEGITPIIFTLESDAGE